MTVKVAKGTRDYIRTTGHETVNRVMSEFDRAVEANRRNERRSLQNWRAYFSVDGGQWPDKLLQKMNDEDRHAESYNIIGPKVDTLAGSLASELFDLDWKPVEGVRNSLTEAVKTSYYADKDLCNYEEVIEEVIKDAMVYRGVMKMEMSNKYSSTRTIDFRRVTPGFFIADPHWIANSDKFLDKAWEIFHLTALQVKTFFGVTNPTIEATIKNDLMNGDEYDDKTFEWGSTDQLMISKNVRRGNLHRVIEYHYMETIKTERVVGKILGSPRWIPFPLTTDEGVLEKFMIDNKVDPMTMRPAPYEDRIHHVITICPSLMNEKPLQQGLSETQPKRLPYLILSANRAGGLDKGVVDDILDIQQTINKRESKLTDMINTAAGGGKLVNRDLFKTADERKRFEKKNSDPSYVEFVDGEELSKDRAIHYLNSNAFPSTLINQLERMWDIIDRVSKVPAAMDAMSESANESGVLFDRKLEVSRIGLVTIINRVKNFRRDMSEIYYEQWQVSYNGPEIEKTTFDGKRTVVLNKRVYDPEQGKIFIENRPAMIPRSMVILSESKSSPNRRMRDRALYSELFNLSTQSNPEYTSFFFQKLIETMELSDKDKEELNEIAAIQKIRDRKRLDSEIKTLDSQEKQAALVSLQSILGIQQLAMQASGGGGLPSVRIPEEEVPQEGGQPVSEEGSFEEIGGSEREGSVEDVLELSR